MAENTRFIREKVNASEDKVNPSPSALETIQNCSRIRGDNLHRKLGDNGRIAVHLSLIHISRKETK